MSEIALITGASAGIGREFAMQLASRCKAMILVARDADKLDTLAEALREKGLSVSCVVADLLQPLGVSAVIEVIRQRGPVSILVNNAGFGTHGPFAESNIDLQLNMVNLHCNASLALCRAVLPYMRTAGGGTIINVASLGSFFPMKNAVVYGASKAFLVAFSQGLAQEVAQDNITVQCLCPGYTHTEFHHRPALDHFDKSVVPDQYWSSSQEVVSASLGALGRKTGTVVVIPGERNLDNARAALAHYLDSM